MKMLFSKSFSSIQHTQMLKIKKNVFSAQNSYCCNKNEFNLNELTVFLELTLTDFNTVFTNKIFSFRPLQFRETAELL